MKTKISLSIIGAYNTIVSIVMMFFASDLVGTIVNSDNADVIRMCEVMHYGLSPAILIIGLTLILCSSFLLKIPIIFLPLIWLYKSKLSSEMIKALMK